MKIVKVLIFQKCLQLLAQANGRRSGKGKCFSRHDASCHVFVHFSFPSFAIIPFLQSEQIHVTTAHNRNDTRVTETEGDT